MPLEIVATINDRGGINCQVTGNKRLAKDHGETAIAEIERQVRNLALAADHTPHIDDRIRRAV